MSAYIAICISILLFASNSYAEGERDTATPVTMQTTANVISTKVGNTKIPSSSDGIDQDSTIFSEDFEVEPTDWATEDLTDIGPMWHPDPFSAYNGNSWWCGDSLWMGYFNLWLQYLDTPTLDLNTTSNPELTFKVRWAMESTTIYPIPPPYDGWDGCNVWISADNGSTWDVIAPLSPAYTCTSLSCFGTVWGFGDGVAGWADSSGGWLDATFDLSGYTSRNIKVRWALCSDRAVSSQGHPEITGFFLDDILLTDGPDTLLWNDADGGEYPAPLTFDTGPPFGDWWEWTTDDAHSPTHSMRVDDDNFYINDALISPPIDIPEGYTTRFKYWVRCDLPDSTHTGSTSLRDFYYVEASTDGVVWDTLFYDYARGGAGYPDWAQMVPGLPYNGNIDMDLSGYAGETIQLRFRVVTDGDHLMGNGEGLFIDDVEVYVNATPADDVGIKSIYIPFPTTVGNTIEGTATVSNFGLNTQNAFYAFWRIDDEVFPIGQSVLWSLPGETDSTVDISFYAEETGGVFINAYTTFTGDMNPANDTSWAGLVEIFPQGNWMMEDGFDARGYSYLDTLLSLSYFQGNGPMVYFGPYYHQGFSWMRFLAWEQGELTLHVFHNGTPTDPGPELGTVQVTIGTGETYPNWKVVDLTNIPEIGYCIGDEFWIWLESTQAGGGPALVADNRHFGEGRIWDYDGSTPVQSQYECYIRALGNDAVGVEPKDEMIVPQTFVLDNLYPNPFNPATEIRFALPGRSHIELQAFDLTGRQVAEIATGDYASGWHTMTWNARDLASGIYLVRLNTEWGTQIKKGLLVK